MSFATVLCLIPENVYGRLSKEKITGNELAAGYQLLYRKIYEYFYGVYGRTQEPRRCMCVYMEG